MREWQVGSVTRIMDHDAPLALIASCHGCLIHLVDPMGITGKMDEALWIPKDYPYQPCCHGRRRPHSSTRRVNAGHSALWVLVTLHWLERPPALSRPPLLSFEGFSAVQEGGVWSPAPPFQSQTGKRTSRDL